MDNQTWEDFKKVWGLSPQGDDVAPEVQAFINNPISVDDLTKKPAAIAPTTPAAPQSEAVPEQQSPAPPTPIEPGPAAQLMQNISPSSNQKDYISGILSKLYKGMGDKEIKEAQDVADRQQLIGRMGLAGQQMASAFTGGQTGSTEVNEDIIKRAQQPVENVLERQKALSQRLNTAIQAQDLNDRSQLKDAKSGVSLAARNILGSIKPDMVNSPGFNDLSAETVFKLEPLIKSALATKTMQSQKEDLKIDKELKDYRDAMDKAYTARSGYLADAAKTMRRSDAVEAFAYGRGNLNDLTPQQVHEVAAAVDTMIRGTSAVGSMKLLIPETAGKSAAEIMQWVTNHPTGTGQQKFIELMLKAAKQEKSVAQEQIKDYQVQAASKFRHLNGVPEFEMNNKALGIDQRLQDYKEGKYESGTKKYIESLKGGKKVVKKQYSPSANKTKFTYEDGSEEIKDGKL